MVTLEEQWQTFRSEEIDPKADGEHLQQIKEVFLSGSLALLTMVAETCPYKLLPKKLQKLIVEVHAYLGKELSAYVEDDNPFSEN